MKPMSPLALPKAVQRLVMMHSRRVMPFPCWITPSALCQQQRCVLQRLQWQPAGNSVHDFRHSWAVTEMNLLLMVENSPSSLNVLTLSSAAPNPQYPSCSASSLSSALWRESVRTTATGELFAFCRYIRCSRSKSAARSNWTRIFAAPLWAKIQNTMQGKIEDDAHSKDYTGDREL